MTGCDLLWAVCGERGAVYRAVCGVRAAVMFGQCAVVAAVRDVVRACGACVFACCVWVRDMRCVACWCALFWVTRAMTLTWCCGGWGLSHRVCLCARVIVWCDGSGERGAVHEVRVGPAKM